MQTLEYITSGEFFPPSKEELEAIISKLEKMLQDERHKDEWKELAKELEFRKEQYIYNHLNNKSI